MRTWQMAVGVAALCVTTGVAFAASRVEKIKNDKVLVTEDTLLPGESEAAPGALPSMIVYMAPGHSQISPAQGAAENRDVKEGETVFRPAGAATIKNTGSSPLHFAVIQFLTPGRPDTWGTTGLAPHYTLLVENRFARAYDIKIPAQSREPQHTHHDRVVVSLSGAQLEHILPDGKIQPSTLKSGEIVWRLGGTHVGHNLGQTDLWVIAVEPK